MTSYKNLEASKFSETSKLLIKSVTNFDESNENFKICQDFVLSTLLYHPYTDANSHEVVHKVSRLHEKFLVNSDLEKAKKFKRVSDNLVGFFREKAIFQMEQGFRILALLLHLSESRSSNNVVLDKQSSTSGSFDWTAYLQEDDISASSLDSEVFTSDESEDDCLDDLPDPLLLCPPPRDDSGLGISPDSCSSQLLYATTILLLQDTVTRPDKNPTTFYPYWMDRYQKAHGSSPYNLRTMNFTKIWNNYLASQKLFTLIDKKVILHEKNVLKEILWMLSGVQDLFLVHWDGFKFIPNSKIHLCNLTSNTLSSSLSEFCTYATKKSLLQNSSKSILQTHTCLTYQAYGESLQEQLQAINEDLYEMDKILRKCSDNFTLLVLKRKMKPVFNKIDFLYQIHKEVSAELSNVSDPFVKSCRLLHALWRLLLNQSIQDQASVCLTTVLRIFLKTCKPYFNFLEDLIILGSFRDLNSEFIIRKRDMSTAEENYWEMSLDLRPLPRDIEQDFFMKPFLKDILSAGKSLEILNSLLKNKPFRLHVQKGDLYLKFIHILQRSICHKSKGLREEEEPKYIENEKDPLLEDTIFSFQRADFFLPGPASRPVYETSTAMHLTGEMKPRSLKPLTWDVTKALNICLEYAYNPVCRRIMKSLKDDHNIITHMSVMRKYFLMESGDLMYSFYSEIFRKVLNKVPWRDISFLYSALQNAIYEDKQNSDKLYVFLVDSPETPHPLNHLNTFQLSYQVKWPITMMLGKSVQSEYSQIFTFLLQIKCAKYLLDNLYSTSLSKYGKKSDLLKAFLRTTFSREQKMHGMYIMRIRLMFFVNGFHNYIMSRILHSFGLEFHNSLEGAETVEEMIGIHRDYLKSLHERCLLDRRILYIKEHIFEVLNLCYIFQQLWLKGVDDVSLEELRSIEKQFSKVNNILLCCFTKPLRRGGTSSYLYLESLVSTMLSNTHSLHVFND